MAKNKPKKLKSNTLVLDSKALKPRNEDLHIARHMRAAGRMADMKTYNRTQVKQDFKKLLNSGV